jgi:3-hydroxybutyryl-CoA dehydrogenase
MPKGDIMGTHSIHKIGIVGAGMMGAGIAEVTAAAGLPTVLVKATPGDLQPVRDRIEASLARRVERGKLSQEEADEALVNLELTADREALADRDLIIESIVENLAEKRMLFSQLDGRVSPSAVFASNTSTLRIRDLADGLRERKTIGLHFFSPVPAMSLVELAYLPDTDTGAVEAASAFVERIGKTAVPVTDSTGFIVNRLLVPYLLGAIRAYSQGLAEAHDIDTAMKLGCGHPMGPLALSDLIGLDVVFAMAKLLFKDFGEASYQPPPLLRRLVQEGSLGKKTGLGLYDYRKKPPQPNQVIRELIRNGRADGEHAA